jgi:curved DNA-binding protein CbpA
MGKTYYQVLGVSPDDEPEHIDFAYKAKVLALEGKHDGASAEQLKLVRYAYGTLSDPHRREKYDRILQEQAEELAEKAGEPEPAGLLGKALGALTGRWRSGK